MTVNIALRTSDVVVLGCDSIASTTSYYLDPFSIGIQTDADGAPIVDADGKVALNRFDFSELEEIVTNSWGGVTKMFLIHPAPAPMVAVTSGIAKLNERTIANCASEFLARFDDAGRRLSDAHEICNEFLRFFREKYEENYKDSRLPENLRQGPNFLVGGYGRSDYLPSVFRVNVQRNEVVERFRSGKGGLSWGGQADAVERFIRGYDSQLRNDLEAHLTRQLAQYAESANQRIAEEINGLLDRLGQSAPADWKLDLPEPAVQDLDWDDYRYPLDYSNMPIQEAINFVAFLVNLQAGKDRFARGVPTVGGRVHVGVVRKEGFELLNEPKLTHRYTGFGDDS